MPQERPGGSFPGSCRDRLTASFYERTLFSAHAAPPLRTREGRRGRFWGNERKERIVLELYQKESCPYSRKVRARLSELGMSWVAHSTEEGSRSSEVLEKLSGSHQVPFLVDAERGVMMAESDAIVEYLNEHYAAGRA